MTVKRLSTHVDVQRAHRRNRGLLRAVNNIAIQLAPVTLEERHVGF